MDKIITQKRTVTISMKAGCYLPKSSQLFALTPLPFLILRATMKNCCKSNLQADPNNEQK
jgi:hypothetical protein